MKKIYIFIAMVVFLSGCSAQRMNISYDATRGESVKLDRPVKGAIVSVIDAREETKIYPKQVIEHRAYSGDISYDINDRTVDEVFRDAIASETDRMGVSLYKLTDITGPLDKDSAIRVSKEISAKYPDIKVAFGARVTEFMAKSQRTLVTTKVNVTATIQFYALDVKTGEVIWADFKTEINDTVSSADHNYMIGELDQALEAVVQKALRGNPSMREFLGKVAAR